MQSVPALTPTIGPAQLAERLVSLRAARELAVGRLPDEQLRDVSELLDRADQRRLVSLPAVTVAVVGPRESLKARVLTALCGQLRGAGRSVSAASLLRPSSAGSVRELAADVAVVQVPHGLRTVMDPNHSDAWSHVTDLLIWVVGTESVEADVADYSSLLRAHQATSVAVVVSRRTSTGAALARRAAALRAVLQTRGLADIPLLSVSRAGEAGSTLPDMVERAVSRRVLEVDLAAREAARAAAALHRACGGAQRVVVDASAARRVVSATGALLGVDLLAARAARTYRAVARVRTAWPPLRWLRRARRRSAAGEVLVRTPALSHEQFSVRAGRVGSAVRHLGDAVTAVGPRSRALALRRVLEGAASPLVDAASGRSLAVRVGVAPAWWSLVQGAHLTALAGLGVGLLLVAATDGDTAWAWGLSGMAVLTGVGTAVVARVLRRRGARAAAARARAEGYRVAGELVTEIVLAPLQREIDAWHRCQDAARAARR